MADEPTTETTSRSRGGFRRGYQPRRKVQINWKDTDTLRRFLNDGGYIRSRRKTGTCAKHQRRLAMAIKRARHMALVPFTMEHVRIMGKG